MGKFQTITILLALLIMAGCVIAAPAFGTTVTYVHKDQSYSDGVYWNATNTLSQTNWAGTDYSKQNGNNLYVSLGVSALVTEDINRVLYQNSASSASSCAFSYGGSYGQSSGIHIYRCDTYHTFSGAGHTWSYSLETEWDKII